MHYINLIVNYLKRKYGAPLHIFFFKNWTRGTSHLKNSDRMNHMDHMRVSGSRILISDPKPDKSIDVLYKLNSEAQIIPEI